MSNSQMKNKETKNEETKNEETILIKVSALQGVEKYLMDIPNDTNLLKIGTQVLGLLRGGLVQKEKEAEK